MHKVNQLIGIHVFTSAPLFLCSEKRTGTLWADAPLSLGLMVKVRWEKKAEQVSFPCSTFLLLTSVSFAEFFHKIFLSLHHGLNLQDPSKIKITVFAD